MAVPNESRLLDGPVVHITKAHYEVIVGHCFDGLPDEACGLLAGPMQGDGAGIEPTGEVHAVHPCRNADQSARTYTVDSRDYLRAMRDAEANGDEIVGVWHSHTHTDAYPSTTDVRQAVDPAWAYVIVSLKHGEPVLRAYRIRDGAIAELPVEVGE
jgi:[CysO sulfur-carrier protein]-S-L-cysteine hydrolase